MLGLFPVGPVDSESSATPQPAPETLSKSRVDPGDSRVASTVIVSVTKDGKAVGWDQVNGDKIATFINDYIKRIDIPNRVSQLITSHWISKDRLVCRTAHAVAATIALTLNGTSLPITAYKQNDASDIDGNIVLKLTRPREYVVQTPLDEGTEVDPFFVPEGPKKITIHVLPELDDLAIRSQLETVGPVKRCQLLREVGTKVLTGVAFVEFDGEITLLTSKIQLLDAVNKVYYLCIGSIQTVNITASTLCRLVAHQGVNDHRKLKVIQIINCVSGPELTDPEYYDFVRQDISNELGKFGNVVSIKIPQPPLDYTWGSTENVVDGVGKVFVEFETEEDAFNAINGVVGRQYNDRTVLCGYFDAEDYRLEVF